MSTEALFQSRTPIRPAGSCRKMGLEPPALWRAGERVPKAVGPVRTVWVRNLALGQTNLVPGLASPLGSSVALGK